MSSLAKEKRMARSARNAAIADGSAAVISTTDLQRSWLEFEWTEEVRDEAIALFESAILRDGRAASGSAR